MKGELRVLECEKEGCFVVPLFVNEAGESVCLFRPRRIIKKGD